MWFHSLRDKLYRPDVLRHAVERNRGTYGVDEHYPAVLLDVYGRAIVGWAMASHMRTELVVEALLMAWTRRRD
jgi:transposase InsO family protein